MGCVTRMLQQHDSFVTTSTLGLIVMKCSKTTFNVTLNFRCGCSLFDRERGIVGYRKLLKDYMAHVQGVTGTTLVELGALTHAIEKRELGELRTIAAEIKRESFNSAPPENDNPVVHAMLTGGQISLTDLEELSDGVSEHDAHPLRERLLASSERDKKPAP